MVHGPVVFAGIVGVVCEGGFGRFRGAGLLTDALWPRLIDPINRSNRPATHE
jgi:hypothetical protein